MADYLDVSNNNNNIAEEAKKDDFHEIQITIRIKECPKNINEPDIRRVPNDPKMFKLHNEYFKFNNIKWGNESQERFYKTVAYSYVEKALQGQSATILAYGPIGTGKSYTMGTRVSGTNNWQNSGLIQRCLKHIFEESKIRVTASFIEIYGTEFHDLFNMGATRSRGVTLNTKIEEIKSLEDGIQLINKALQIRQGQRTSRSSLRKISSVQSHIFLTFYLKIEDGKNYIESRLNLVDLAGTRITPDIDGEPDSFGAKVSFDESLSALRRVVNVISKKFDPDAILSHKDNILSSLLEDLFDDKSPISLIACISAGPPSNSSATFRTLRIAEEIQTIQLQRRMGCVNSDLSTKELKPKREQLAVVSSSQSPKIDTIFKRNKEIVISPALKEKIKDCMVVLKKTDIHLYERNGVEYLGNISPVNSDNGVDTENSEIPSTDIDFGNSADTKSTLSISRLQTQSTVRETDIKTELEDCSEDEDGTAGSDYNFSLGSLENMATANPAECDAYDNDDLPDDNCECLIRDFEHPTELLEISQSGDQNGEEKELGLIDNVSQLSISGAEINPKPDYLDEVLERQGIPRSEVVEDILCQIHEHGQSLPFGSKLTNKMKRMNAILTTDFSQPGPSGVDYETPRKIRKIDRRHLSSTSHSGSDSAEESQDQTPPKKNHSDNIKNKKKEINDKQKAHNNNILRILNTWTAEKLTDLPRIGFKTAVSIYQYRLINGEFKSLKSLRRLPFWSEKTCQAFFAANNVFF